MSSGASIPVDLELRTEEAEQRASELKNALKKLNEVDPGGAAVKLMSDELAQAREEAAGLRAQMTEIAGAAKGLSEKQGKAQNLFLQALGGEEMPERINKITDGLKLAGDSSLSFTSRLMAGVGAMGLAAGAAGILYGSVSKVVEWVRASDAAAEAHKQVLRELGPAYGTASEAAHGLATAEQLLATQRAANAAREQLSAESLGQLTEAMQVHARETGGNAAQATQQFLQAFQAHDVATLARFGVHLTEADFATRNLGKAVQQTSETYRGWTTTTDLWEEAEKSAHKGVALSLNDVQRRYLELRGIDVQRVQHRQQNLQVAQRVAEAEREGAAQTAAAYARQQREVERLSTARRTLHDATMGAQSAEDFARQALEKHAIQLREQIALGEQAQQPLDANASAYERFVHGLDLAAHSAENTQRAQADLAQTEQLLRDAANSANTAQRNLAFAFRDNETEAQRFARRLAAATELAKRHREEQAENVKIMRLLREEFKASEIPISVDSGGGGPGVAEIREAQNAISAVMAHYARAGGQLSVAFGTIVRGEHETRLHYLRRYAHEVEAILGTRMPEMIRHGGETQTAFLLRTVQAAQGVMQQVTQEYEADRQAILQRQQSDAQDEVDREHALRQAAREREVSDVQHHFEALRTLRNAVNARDEESRGIERGIGRARTTAAATAGAEDLYRDGESPAARLSAMLQLRSLHTQAMAAEAAGNRELSETLRDQEQAIAGIITAHDAHAAAMERTGTVAELMYARMSQAAGGAATMQEHSASIIGAAWDSVSGALSNHLAAVMQGKEEFGAAMQAMAKDALTALSTRAIGEALANLAGGFAALATYRPVEAGNHFAAFGLWSAVAALSGGIAAAIPSPSDAASKGAGAAGGSSPRASSAVPAGGSGERAPINYTINFSSFVADESAGERLFGLMRSELRRGNSLS